MPFYDYQCSCCLHVSESRTLAGGQPPDQIRCPECAGMSNRVWSPPYIGSTGHNAQHPSTGARVRTSRRARAGRFRG